MVVVVGRVVWGGRHMVYASLPDCAALVSDTAGSTPSTPATSVELGTPSSPAASRQGQPHAYCSAARIKHERSHMSSRHVPGAGVRACS